MTEQGIMKTELAIVGAGLAGLAAGAFALRRGIPVALAGGTGGLAFTTGYLDLLGLSLSEQSGFLAEPLEGLDTLRDAQPDHPYALLRNEEITAAFTEFLACLEEAGLPYAASGLNMPVVSPLGTLKCTYALPRTMLAGTEALSARSPCLLADFIGLKAFSAREMAVNLRPFWPEITPVSVAFPDAGHGGELYPEAMARALEVPAVREALMDALRPHLGSARCVGLPAVLGVYNSAGVCDHLSQGLGLPVFEVPTLPPGVPGLRLRECMEEFLRTGGARLFAQRRVFAVRREPADGAFLLDIGETGPEAALRAEALILATGRFLSGGLVGSREQGVSEPLLGLPVTAPERANWHRDDYFDPAGHPINRAGVVTDADFRPLSGNGRPVDANLFAAGSLLAGQDWVREKSGAGIAVATAWKAVNAYAAARGTTG